MFSTEGTTKMAELPVTNRLMQNIVSLKLDPFYPIRKIYLIESANIKNIKY